MGSFALLNPTLWINAADFSGYARKAVLHPTVAELDVTTFATGGRARLGGLRTVDFSVDGFMDTTAAPDVELWADFAQKDTPVTVSSEGIEAKTAWMFQAGVFGYDQFDAEGLAAPFVVSGKNTNKQGLVRGQMAKAKGSVNATGQLGSILTMTGPLTGQFVYVVVHSFAPVGTTVTVQVQSSTVIGFGAPTVQGTFTAITTLGGFWIARIPGPLTDGFWRLNVSAITGTFILAGAIGVGS